MDLDRPLLQRTTAAATGAAAFALYLATLAPTVALIDSGELTFAASLLDIPHPPGTPLYVLVGYLFSLLPWETPAFRLNLMSAFFAALAAGAAFLLATRTLSPPLPPDRQGARKKRGPTAAPAGTVPAAATAAALVAGLTFASSGTLWSYATVAEVYTLNTALLGLALFFFLGAPGSHSAWDLRLALLFFGMALAVHHVSALFLVPGALYLIWKRRAGASSLKELVFLLPGLATYLYLPIRASQKPLLNWGDPSTLERFFWHVSGKQYRSNFTPDLDTLLSRGWFFLKLTANEFTLVGIILVLLGLFLLWSKSRQLFVFIAVTVSCNWLYALVYDIAEDNEAYLLPSFLLFVIALAWGLRHVFEAAWLRGKSVIIPVWGLLSLLPVLSVVTLYEENNHRHYFVARDYGLNVLENLQPKALLLTMDWQLYSPLLYLQHVEQYRNDVLSVDVNLLRRSWYVAYLKRQYPGLMQAADDETDIYLKQLELFEHGRPFSPNVIQQAFVNLINRLVEITFSRKDPVYATVDRSEEPAVAQDYFRVPIGPLFRLYDSRPAQPLGPGRLRTDSFTNGLLELDPVMRRVRKNYALMCVNQSIYLKSYGRETEAAEWRQRGLRLDPEVEAMIPRNGAD
ncbi:MAG: DUF2723 domain-containing protein [Acidobacteria bacterium]|nr:MAG: DUF2723 domain-containing protein [Acidobacteriota bacterium]